MEFIERRKVEKDRLALIEEIEAQRKRLNHILSSLPCVVWEAALHEATSLPMTSFVNSYVEKMHGYTVEEWLSSPYFWLSTVHPDDRKLITDSSAELLANGRGRNEFRWIRKDGAVIWGESQVVLVKDETGKVVGMTGVTTDITERKRMEEERHVISEIIQGVITTPNLDELLKLIHQAISKVINAENCFVALHESSTDSINFEFWVDKLDQCPEPRKIGKDFCSYIVKTGLPLLLDRKLTDEFVQRGEIVSSGISSASWLGVPLRTISRTIGVLVVQHYEDERAYSRRDLEFLVSVGSQIALAIERKRTERALTEANGRALTEYERLIERIAALGQSLGLARDLTTIFRALRDFTISSVPCDGLFISLYDKETKTRQATYCWADEAEFDPKDVQPIPVRDGMTGQAIKSGTVIINNDFQLHIQAREKPLIVGECTPTTTPQSALAAPITVMGRTIGCVEIQSYQLDAYRHEHATAMRMAANLAANAIENARLIEREQAKEEQLQQSQKMEAVGRLAGGIAHDFNNLLTAINGYSDLTLRKLDPKSDLCGRIKEIRKAGERAASLTRQLLAFSRKQMLQPRVLDLNSVITEMHKMLHRLIGEDIVLQLALGNLLGQVKADPGQIEQILMNLAVNARDAMPQGGRLTIETRNVLLNQTHVNRQLVPQPGNYVMISVSDDGCGMDGETQAHIFEPFFTTKGVGKGTGLGLSTVYGIVKQSDGGIWVYSELGKGTAFNICFPRVDELSPAEESAASAEVPGGDETILLVEDEDLVRALSKEMLEQYGYSVISASNGDEGVRICKEFAGPIDLMITDVVMPHMSGRELAERIGILRPGMQVLYMSGFTDDAIVRHGLLDKDFAFIQKPFSPESLALKAREVLDQSQPALN